VVVTAGSREVPGRTGLRQETTTATTITIIISCVRILLGPRKNISCEKFRDQIKLANTDHEVDEKKNKLIGICSGDIMFFCEIYTEIYDIV
jgi:hypothetical protein